MPPTVPAAPNPISLGLVLNALLATGIFYLMLTERITVPKSLNELVNWYFYATGYTVSAALVKTGFLGFCIKAAVIIIALPFAFVYHAYIILADIIDRTMSMRRFMGTLERDFSQKISPGVSAPPVEAQIPKGGVEDATEAEGPQSTYQYSPLGADDEIRLLELLPANPDEATDAPLRGRITHARLSDIPEYTALSYCWNDKPYAAAGTSKADPILDVGADGIIVLTRNLFTGLHCARRKGHFDSRLFWVDQICINQQDLAEKAVQVALMKDIYKRAGLVLVWLGDDTPTGDGRRALDFADRIAVCIDEKGLLSPEFDFFPITFKSNDLGLPPIHTAVIEYMSLMILLTRPWFTRSWVVQEVSLGDMAEKRVLLGDTEMSFNAVATALLFCVKSIEFLLDWVPAESRAAFRALIQSSVFSKREEGRPSRALLDVLVRHRGCQATLARDKVFAFLNISDDSERLGIKAEYTVCTKKVMIDTAMAIIQQYDNLDIFSSANAWPPLTTNPDGTPMDKCMDGTVPCQATDHAPRLPSWAPDWSRASYAPSFQSRGDFGEYFTNYRASADSVKEVHFREDNTQMGLHGRIIDQIVAVGPGFVESQGLDIGTHYRIMKSWGDFYGIWDRKRKGETYATNEPLLTAFVNLVTCGGKDVTIQSSKPVPAQDKSSGKEPWLGDGDFTAQFNMLMVVFHANWVIESIWPGVAANPVANNVMYAIFGVPLILWAHILSKLGLGARLSTVSSGFRQRFFASVNYRRLIQTKSGFIGLASPQVQPNDWIGLFSGGAVPLVVRDVQIESDLLLQMVGDAYVHGMMFGDAWEIAPEPQIWWFC